MTLVFLTPARMALLRVEELETREAILKESLVRGCVPVRTARRRGAHLLAGGAQTFIKQRFAEKPDKNGILAIERCEWAPLRRANAPPLRGGCDSTTTDRGRSLKTELSKVGGEIATARKTYECVARGGDDVELVRA